MPTSLRALLAIATLFAPFATARAQDTTLFFVGGAHGEGSSPTLEQLEARLKTADPKTDVVVFTGNYARTELPEEDDPARASVERAVMAHVKATKAFAAEGGRVYYLPGHLDFAAGGSKAVKRLRKFLNEAYGEPTEDVMPEAACGEPAVIELNDGLGLALVNSQWWMQEWEDDPHANQGCKVKSREAFALYFRDALNDFRTRRLVVAMYHPLLSYGEMGDSYSLQSHLQPAPIVGTVSVLLSQVGLVPQHRNHPRFHSFVKLLTSETARYGSFVFASGHDENLQLLTVEGQTQIIAGTSGPDAKPVVTPDEGHFAEATPGWAELHLDAHGNGDTKLVVGNNVVFEKALPVMVPYAPAPKEPPKPMPAGPFMSTYTKAKGSKMSAVGKLLLGTFYSDAYTLELPYEVLNLETEKGGMTPTKTGGSFQTNSLRLVDITGAEWAARAVTKDSGRFLGKKDDPTQEAEGGTLGHAFTSMQPEAALAVPKLLEAVNVLHAEPRLMYLPDQERLGKFRGYLRDELVLLEQSPKTPDTGELPKWFGGPGDVKFKDTEEMIEKLEDDPDKHVLDQEAYLRARLIDVLVGDWDRHQGQWKWAVKTQEDGTKLYLPIPRDRDQAFANFDGFGLAIARISSLQPRQLQPYDGTFHNLAWLIYSARYMDPTLTNRLDRTQWLEVAAQVKAALTDEVIDAAFATWHREAFELDGVNIVRALKQRRDQLPEVASDYFALVSKNADVIASVHDDRVDLYFDDDGSVRLTIATTKKKPWFDRRYQPNETAQLRIYALDGDDTLTVHGRGHRNFDIRFIGGEGHDVLKGEPGKTTDASSIGFYDLEKGATFDPAVRIDDERSNLASLNQYDRLENHEPGGATVIPGLAINPDDGVLLGAVFDQVVHGYKKSPFAARHDLLGRFATATLGAALDYRGVFPNSLELLDQRLDLSLRTPQWTRNFFGYSNEYPNKALPLDYYRVRQAAFEARYGVTYGFGGDRSHVGAQLTGQVLRTEETVGRFVSVSSDVDDDVFGSKLYVGARLFAQTSTYDKQTLPTKGVGLRGSIESRFDAKNGGPLSTNYKLQGSLAFPFDRARRVVLASRAGVEGIIGRHAFYFSPTLGEDELPAYHRQQLSGDLAFAHSTDLRIDVFRSEATTPGTFGVDLSIDHGRVFGEGISSSTWHLSLGGSIYWAVMDTIALSVGYYRSLDGGSRFMMTLGPLFAPAM